jgi:hypothetical protein
LGFSIALAIPTLAMFPYVDGTEISFYVTARRGDQELLARRHLGDANVTNVVTLNPAILLGTSSERAVARAIGADVVVATMYQLTRSEK